MIRNVIFDLDGTLLDSEYRALNIKKTVLARHGVEPTDELLSRIAARKLTHSLPQVIEDPKLVKEILDDYYSFAYSDVDYTNLSLPGSTELLRELKDQGYTLALATISDWKKVNQVIEQCGWQNIFDFITTLDDVKKPKPDPEVYLTILERLKLKREETIVVEDVWVGIEAAHQAGLKVICRKEKRLPVNQQGADYYVDDLGEVIEIIKDI